MKSIVISLVAGTLVAAAGCQTVSGSDSPARLGESSPESHAVIQQAVSEALGQPVAIAADALTGDSLLIVERRPPAGAEGRLATGRNMEPAVQFRLVSSGGDCFLVDTRDDSRYPLPGIKCVPE